MWTKIHGVPWLGEMITRQCRAWTCLPCLLDHMDPTFRFLSFVIHRTAFAVVLLQHRMPVHIEHLKENTVFRISQLFLT